MTTVEGDATSGTASISETESIDESMEMVSSQNTRASDTQGSNQAADRNDYSQETLNALRKLTFRKFVDHLKWSTGLVSSFQSNNLERMARNMVEMVVQVHNSEDFSFHQHLELGRQIEHYASVLERNTMDVVDEVAGIEGMKYSVGYLKEIVRCAWSVYRYPILGQAVLPWNKGKRGETKKKQQQQTNHESICF